MAYDTINSKPAEMLGYSHVTDDQIYHLETTYGASHYRRLRSVVRRTEGAWLYMDDGTKILDCLAAYSAANPGHHHPKIVAALVHALQHGYGSVISNVIYTDTRAL
ncbi:MAG: aminotransferase class III-fold pyridoxal phosphate-dependent enzyme, partial [candidate division Zixibacteria bacterium]|nr:aminotransferase class III-fold pyridoxal phosphate-dependent enzyme [candidate division Zixibacteria bacterium]